MALGDKKYISFVEDWGRPNSPATLDENGILNKVQWASQTKWQSNPNLLDNGYFVGDGTPGKFPINQRGRASYSYASDGSNMIDRWKILTASANLTGSGLAVTPTQYNNTLIQYLDNWESLIGKTVTLSVWFEEVNGAVFLVANNTVLATASAAGVHSVTFVVPSTDQNFISLATGDSYKIKAAKLELGDTQTLAHQDEKGNWVPNEIPDYGTELAKCQRYYRLWRDEATRTQALKEVGLMRTAPSVGTIVVDSTTYYYANAEL